MAILGYLVLAAAAVLGVVAWKVKRPGESWEHAYERILNTDEHKQREAKRLAGLSDALPAAAVSVPRRQEPAPPPGGDEAPREEFIRSSKGAPDG